MVSGLAECLPDLNGVLTEYKVKSPWALITVIHLKMHSGVFMDTHIPS